MFLATAVFAVGWAAVLWDTRFVTDPSGPWDVVKYGFLGAYAFVTSMLIRRFFQSDLRPSAYATAVFRIILVLLIIVVLHQVMDETSTMAYRGELAVAFVVGFFPLVGLQFLQRVTSKVLGLIVPPVTPAYPLDQLDGFNLWYEARLTEEGVEDMQNLTTMNLVDVILHTRVPPGRLVDWTDQAFLLTHLEQAGRRQLTRQRKSQGAAGKSATEGDAEPGVQARLNLRRVGIRTATDLLKAFSEPAPEPGPPWRRDFSLGGIRIAAAPRRSAQAPGQGPGRRARPQPGLELATERGPAVPGTVPARSPLAPRPRGVAAGQRPDDPVRADAEGPLEAGHRRPGLGPDDPVDRQAQARIVGQVAEPEFLLDPGDARRLDRDLRPGERLGAGRRQARPRPSGR